MRKHLIGTILVLAALAACNKEVETPAPAVDNGQEEVTPGKVTLTFTAAIGDDTRTEYPDDKTAGWVIGDKISVCVAKAGNTDYKIAEFEATSSTDAGMEFTGKVEPGYTTIVSGVYPANDVYSSSPNNYFKDGAVKSVYLPNSYNLEDADDTGRFIPLIGSYDGESMTFSHFCSTMKVTLTNIPTDATVFTFTTNGKQIAGDFTLSVEGRMAMANQTSNNSVQFTFGPVLTERSFYIPIPDGQLTAGSYVTVEKTIENSNNEVLFKKVINSTPTFPRTSDNKDAIRILPAVACWTKNENWNAYYYGSYKTSGVIKKRISIENVTGSYQYEVLTSSKFSNTYHGSAADYLTSSDFSEKIAGLNASDLKTGDLYLTYTSLNPGTRYVMIFGLDNDLKFTGEYNCIKVVYPTFTTPDGWSITVSESESDSRLNYSVPDGTKWNYISIKKSSFESTYLDDLEYLIYYTIRNRKNSYDSGSSEWAPLTGNHAYPVNYSGEYVLLSVGIDDNYRPTGEYCRLDYSFETPSDQYNAWLGTWTVTDETNTDTWTISRRQANHSYTITGIAGQEYKVVGEYNDGSLTLSSQLLEEKYGTNQRDLYLLARNSSGNLASNPLLTRLILTATIENGNVTVTPSTETAPGGYGIYYKIANYNPRGVRDFSHTISMIKQ